MKLIITGCPRGKGVNHTVIRESINYFQSSIFGLIDALHDIEVQFNIIPNLLNDYGGTGFAGYRDTNINPKRFIMEVDSDLSLKTTLITTAHEFVHVKQMATGQSQYSIDGQKIRWNGEIIHLDDVHYYDQPWEIEAHGREYGMYDRFVNRHSAEELTPAIIQDPASRLKLA